MEHEKGPLERTVIYEDPLFRWHASYKQCKEKAKFGAPKGNINTTILHSDSKAQGKEGILPFLVSSFRPL